jgi:thioredoxin-like negative regulator of GroEL
MVGGAVGVIWAASAIFSYRWDRSQIRLQNPRPAEDLFPVALDHYLKGNWFEAEQVLGGLLQANPRDVDASLMLATLYRHTHRYDEAQGQLERLTRYEGAEKWRLEITRERELLGQARNDSAAEPSGETPPSPADPSCEVMEAA